MPDDSLSSQNLDSFLKNLTSSPGVYRMINALQEVLYVGKASHLKKRVSSYFNKQHGPKTRALVQQIATIDVTVTRTETEALLLESSLIKSLRPKYNVLLRDDKSYPYLHLHRHPFPRMEVVRMKKKPKGEAFFGPYPSASAVRETLKMIQKTFKIRDCSDTDFSTRTRPCLQYQIQRCSAPCTEFISPENYQQSIRDAVRFLQGKSQLVIEELNQRMDQAVSQLAFEEAARIRDQIKSLRLIQEQQGVVQLRGDIDVIAIEAQPGFACVQCVSIREGEVIASQSFFPSIPNTGLMDVEEDQEALWQKVFTAFIAHYYFDTPERIPGLMITHHDLSDLDNLQQILTELRQKVCLIKTKPRGANARWLDFAKNNLQLALSEHTSSRALILARYASLSHYLHLTSPIHRMVCFDISHTQGEATIASCVVFDESGPCKNEYRRFNITGITPGDDYAAMRQALNRYFKRLMQEEKSLPELLVIDGGKGQVTVAKEVLAGLDIHQVGLLGIAKGPGRKAGLERFILSHQEDELLMPPDSPGFHLLQHIRDEAHRFAITAHRKKRQKIGLSSSLEDIEGVGPKRRQALLRRFGGLRELAKAPLEEIAKVSGFHLALAIRVYEHFHRE